MARIWLFFGCVFSFIAVALGAFGAHALKNELDPGKMEIFLTANQYMATHAFALIALGLWSQLEKWSSTRGVGICFLSGIFLFSGSLYTYVLLGVRNAALVTPVGGTLFLIGWILFAISVVSTKKSSII